MTVQSEGAGVDPIEPEWRVELDGEDAADPTVGLAMDVDPRQRVLWLGVRVLSGGAAPLWSGAVARRFFEGARADWAASTRWLDGPEARALMAAISAGYEAEMLWSGDWSASWSEGAALALEALHRGVGERLEIVDDPEG